MRQNVKRKKPQSPKALKARRDPLFDKNARKAGFVYLKAPPRLESPPGTRRRLPPSLSQSKQGSTVSKRNDRSCDRLFMHSSSRIRNNQIEAQRSGFDLGRRSDGTKINCEPNEVGRSLKGRRSQHSAVFAARRKRNGADFF